MMRNVFLAVCVAAVSGTTAEAAIKTKVVNYTYDGTPLKGFLAWDDAVQGKRPGVLVVHEWWGLNDYARKRAEELAKFGFVAFACDMYGEGKTTEHPKEAGQFATEVRKNIKVLARAALPGSVRRFWRTIRWWTAPSSRPSATASAAPPRCSWLTPERPSRRPSPSMRACRSQLPKRPRPSRPGSSICNGGSR